VAYNKKIKAYAIKRGVFIAICVLCIVFILSGGYLFYRNIMSEEAANSSSGRSNKVQSSTIVIARAKLSMRQGEIMDVSKAELVEVPEELAPKGSITNLSKLNNMRLKRELSEKEFLNVLDLMTESASYEEGDRLIEHNFAEGAIPAAVAEGSAIDIKLFVKGGEDCVVISKAVVVSRNANLLSFYMNKVEQEFLKEAAAEGILLAVQYIDDSQLASDVTFIPLYDKSKLKE
jgi:hypothetical protein